jgi:hypothetical protein
VRHDRSSSTAEMRCVEIPLPFRCQSAFGGQNSVKIPLFEVTAAEA